MIELLAPAGNFSKLQTAIHFGADAVYLGGMQFSLRAFADNFSHDELKNAFDFLHEKGKKGYVTANIFAKNADFELLGDFFKFLEGFADGVIISDPGVLDLCKKIAPKLEIHLSTQANTLNKYAAKFWAEQGVKRIVLARELSLREIREIRDFIPQDCMLEAFVHGAMCISYSGRCLLSSHLSNRDGNRGECVQACRWHYALKEREYEMHEQKRPGKPLTICEDERGTYILNSKDLNMFAYLKEMLASGIEAFKIEGRMKSEYYVGTVVSAYAKAFESIKKGQEIDRSLANDLFKTGHREYTTAFAVSDGKNMQCHESAQPTQTYDFVALILEKTENGIWIEQRNRFQTGDTLEVLSSGENHNKPLYVSEILDTNGDLVEDARFVQQKLFLKTDLELQPFDMLRKVKVEK